MLYGGREFLVRTFTAEGYQGYLRPAGWQGQVMVPVNVAFHGSGANALASLDVDVADGLLSHARSFCPPLFEIMSAAETIRRVAWNGQVMTAGQRGELLKLKTILDQISETGSRSDELFSQSIRDLYEMVLASRLRDAEFVSHLLVDLLDRNLYERSDDCRWWALTPELRHALASDERDFETDEGITAILDYINRLYTVYTRIFVYDREGRIIASNNAVEEGISVIGTRVDAVTLAAVHGLRSEQDYRVTPFAPTPLYGNRATYVYHAAIRDPQQESVIVGGIGIVFDSEPEFAAMLRGGLEHATFFIDGMLFAIPAASVLEALPASEVAPVSMVGRLLIQSLDVGQLFACLKDPSLPTILNLDDVQRLAAGSYEDAAALMGEAA